MVNDALSTATTERRGSDRPAANHVASLGVANLNPFGDLHTVQHLSARLARSLRGVFEPVLRRNLRTWAEPLVVQRFADYVAERESGLTAWLPLAITPADGARAFAVFDGGFVIETLDLFFGGPGERPKPLPSEFTPAAEAMIRRLGTMLAEPMRAAWEPLARISFAPGNPEASSAMLGIDGDDAVIITRFGLAAEGAPVFIDLVYPVAVLKPFTPSLTGKVHGRTAAPEPKWRTGLTRAAMNVRFPVRSVLAEPVIPLAQLMELKVGDVIPLSFGPEVPVMVGSDRLGLGTVGTANGKAAIRITRLERLDEEDYA
jgi:flagellar motor switch protein FliM